MRIPSGGDRSGMQHEQTAAPSVKAQIQEALPKASSRITDMREVYALASQLAASALRNTLAASSTYGCHQPRNFDVFRQQLLADLNGPGAVESVWRLGASSHAEAEGLAQALRHGVGFEALFDRACARVDALKQGLQESEGPWRNDVAQLFSLLAAFPQVAPATFSALGFEHLSAFPPPEDLDTRAWQPSERELYAALTAHYDKERWVSRAKTAGIVLGSLALTVGVPLVVGAALSAAATSAALVGTSAVTTGTLLTGAIAGAVVGIGRGFAHVEGKQKADRDIGAAASAGLQTALASQTAHGEATVAWKEGVIMALGDSVGALLGGSAAAAVASHLGKAVGLRAANTIGGPLLVRETVLSAGRGTLGTYVSYDYQRAQENKSGDGGSAAGLLLQGAFVGAATAAVGVAVGAPLVLTCLGRLKTKTKIALPSATGKPSSVATNPVAQPKAQAPAIAAGKAGTASPAPSLPAVVAQRPRYQASQAPELLAAAREGKPFNLLDLMRVHGRLQGLPGSANLGKLRAGTQPVDAQAGTAANFPAEPLKPLAMLTRDINLGMNGLGMNGAKDAHVFAAGAKVDFLGIMPFSDGNEAVADALSHYILIRLKAAE